MLKINDAAMGRRLGISPRRYNNYAAGLREPTFEIAGKICEILSIDPADLLGMKRRDFAQTHIPESHPTLYSQIEVLDVQASAGTGMVVRDEEAIGHVMFRTDWLRVLTPTPVEELKFIEAEGDSMEPTIHSGDQMLIDLRQKNPRRDGIYVIDWDGFLSIKRVTADSTTQTLTVSSDNKNYVSKPGVSPEAIRVVGRVIWYGRRV